MIKKYVALLIALITIQNSFAQKSINNYKYVIVPYKFDFVNAKDKYRINTLTRHLFKTNGFDVYFDEENLPEDLFKDRCLAMYANVIKEKALLATKVYIELKNCRGAVILKSELGKSKDKEFDIAYSEAIKEAFQSIAFLNYEYIPKKDDNIDATSQTEEDNTSDKLVQLKKEIEELKTENAELIKTVGVTQNSEDISTTKQTETIQEVISSSKGISDEAKKMDSKPILDDKEHFAKYRVYQFNGKNFRLKEHQRGYDLVDINGNVVYKLLSTSQKTVYIAVGDFKQGVAIHDFEKQSISVEFYNNDKKRITETFIML